MTARTLNRTVAAAAAAPFTVALYLRLSVDKNGDGAGVARQEKAGRLLAKAKGERWRNVVVYCDNDRSATSNRKRPEFERLVKDIAEGRVQAVICWHLDRLVRKMSDLTRVIEAGKDRKLNIATVHGVSLDMGDPTGIAVAQILTAIAGMEVAHKGARQQASNQQRAENGRQSASRVFGYNGDGTVREAEAVLVKEVFSRFATGAPITELSKYLSATGLRGASGRAPNGHGPWHRSSVRKMLTNRRYVGEVWYRGEYVREGTWTALVDPDTFAAAAAKLADPTRKTTTTPDRKHLGPGLYRCGICADAGVLNTVASFTNTVPSSRGRDRYRYLVCSEHRTRPGQHLTVPMDLVDEHVKHAITERLNDPKIMKARKADATVSAARELSEELTALRAKEDALALDQVSDDPDYTGRQVKIMTAKLHERIAEIESTLADLGRRSVLAELARAANPGDAWLELDVFRAAEAVDALATITVWKGARRNWDPKAAVEIAWKQ